MKKVFITTLIISFILPLTGQALTYDEIVRDETGGQVLGLSLKTDYNNYAVPYPAPTLPAAGGTFKDPTFGTTIMRVTDANDGTECGTTYSYYPSFNKDSTWLFGTCRVAVNTWVESWFNLYQWDPVNMKVLSKKILTPARSKNLNLTEGVWSALDPNVIFAFGGVGNKIYAYNVVTEQATLIKDFSTVFPGEYIWQISRSIDDNRFAFTRKNSSTYAEVGYAVWQRNPDTMVYTSAALPVNEVQVDKTGQYLMVQTGDQGLGKIEGKIVNLSTGASINVLDSAPANGVLGYNLSHHDTGSSIHVGAENWTGALWKRDLTNPSQMTKLIDAGYNRPIPSLGGHYSILSDDENWMLVSGYTLSTSVPAHLNQGVLQNELFLISTTGSGQVKRLAHHQSFLISGTDYYYDTPRANISRDGKYVAFTSNWGNSGRRDLFVVATFDVPPDITPPPTDTTPPVFSAIIATPTSTAATISWATNEASDAQIDYGTASTSLTSTSPVTDAGSSMKTSHTVTLSSLTPSTTYYYQVKSRDATGNLAISPVAANQFTTSSITLGDSIQRKLVIDPQGISTNRTATGTIQFINTTTKTIATSLPFTTNIAGEYTFSPPSSLPSSAALRVVIAGYLPRLVSNADLTTNSLVTISIPQLYAGDFNNDNIINSLDYSLLNQKWHQSTSLGSTDINKDGIINSLDFVIISGNWLKIGE